MKIGIIFIVAIILLTIIVYVLIGKSPVQEKDLEKMEIKSVFNQHEKIPAKFTADGEDINPELVIKNIPKNAKSLVLIMDDPDALGDTWIHWVVFNIPIINKIDENSVPSRAIQGKNSWGNNNYGGPSPPSGTHRYFFKVYALSTKLDLDANADKATVENAMQKYILDQAELVGVYSR